MRFNRRFSRTSAGIHLLAKFTYGLDLAGIEYEVYNLEEDPLIVVCEYEISDGIVRES